MSGTLSVQLYSVRDHLAADRPGTLRRLADIGYRHVEPFALALWDTPLAERAAAARAFRADLDAAGLAVSSLHGAIAAGSQAALVEECRALGADTVFVPVPFLVEGFGEGVFDNRETLSAFAQRLNEAARELADHGIRLGYHNHTFEWSELPDGSPGFDVLWDLLDPSVVAEVDLYWATVAGQDPAHVLARLGDRAVAAHVKDGPGAPDDPLTARPQTPLGTGVLDAPAALRAGDHLRWHITEIDTTEADPFKLLATNRDTLLGTGLTTP
ncbi:sugar phosphate isomerase/epimerase family protein [Yinghuangia sp. YIM S10712]|uniref:sugar phosphate isomerase/epimerase family protein n=1 Tax=Yinghuangia sp. YIM S10712 TaxID=3436930 RepID=UPI003F52D8BC